MGDIIIIWVVIFGPALLLLIAAPVQRPRPPDPPRPPVDMDRYDTDHMRASGNPRLQALADEVERGRERRKRREKDQR